MRVEHWTISVRQDGAWFLAVAETQTRRFEARRPTAEQAWAEVLNAIKRWKQPA